MKNGFKISLSITLLALSGCVAASVTHTAGIQGQNSASSTGQSHEQDVRAIERILAETSDAWNRHDPEGLAAHSTDDIDHIGVRGVWSRGRTELRAQLAKVAPQINNTVTGSVQRVRFLSPDIAVAIIRRQYKSQTETRDAIGTSVFQRINGQWFVTAFQNTYVQ